MFNLGGSGEARLKNFFQLHSYLTDSSLIRLITLNSALKHISLIHSDAYKKRIH